MVHYYFLVLTPEVLGAPSSSTGSARKTDPCLVCMTLEKLIVNGSICPIPGPKQVDISNIIRQEGVITVFYYMLTTALLAVLTSSSEKQAVHCAASCAAGMSQPVLNRLHWLRNSAH